MTTDFRHQTADPETGLRRCFDLLKRLGATRVVYVSLTDNAVVTVGERRQAFEVRSLEGFMKEAIAFVDGAVKEAAAAAAIAKAGKATSVEVFFPQANPWWAGPVFDRWAGSMSAAFGLPLPAQFNERGFKLLLP